MSAPLAGKFSDHYEVLGVDSKADAEAIKDAYAKLAALYSPTNTATGDKEKFDELNAAYEVLSDPHLRKAFDGVRSGGSEDDSISFPVQEFIDGLGADAARRRCLLALLYYRRKSATISPGISMRQVETLMKITQDQLSFMVWVLKQQGLVSSDDKSRLLVTVTGIENIEANKPTAADIEPWLRSSAEQAAAAPVAETKATPAKPQPVAEAKPAPAEKPPLREAPALTPEGMATAGLSSLRTALQKSMGPRPAGTPAPKPAEAPKTTATSRP